MEITLFYQKERKEFGRPVNTFAAGDVTVLEEFETDQELFRNHIERNPSVLDLQCKAELSQAEVNTESFKYIPLGMSHMEGGWPKDIDCTEKDQTTRFKKKVEKDDDYIRQVKLLAESVEADIKMNYAIDIYQEYFSGEYADHASEPPSAKTLSVFKDPEQIKRTVSNISWYPDGGKKLAIAFSIMQFQDYRMDSMSANSYIWDVHNPNTPETTLVPPSALCCLEYNPKDPHLLVGGCYNGLVSYFDTRKGEAPVDTSIIEKSHRDPVYKMAWLAGKTPTECASTSTDGQVLWWDIRRLGEPSEYLSLDDKTEPGSVLGGCSMDYASAGKFLVGTEQGKIQSCQRKGKTNADKLSTLYEGHCGPVYGLQRNPWYPKFFLTTGDWTVRLWNEELKAPIMTSKYFQNYVQDAAWSPTRSGVFCTTKMDGTLDVWDYFYKQNDPTLSLQIDDDGLFTVAMQEQGSLVATGSVDGSVYMLELCEGLATMQQNEKQSVNQMLDRESKREKNLEARAKEMRQKEKRAAETQESTETKATWAEQEKSIEEDFWKTVEAYTKKEEGYAAGGEEAANGTAAQ